MSVLSKAYFHNEEAAFAYLESIVWADGKACPHCGAVDRLTAVKANPAKRIRVGLHRCGHCKGQFTVKVGTVFEHMRLPLHKALQAVYLMTSSKKGISAHQLHRVLEITYKSAWFLAHRVREAMRDGDLSSTAVEAPQKTPSCCCRLRSGYALPTPPAARNPRPASTDPRNAKGVPFARR